MERFKTSGVCSSEILFEVEDNSVKEVSFVRGCPGNTLGVASLIKGMPVPEAIAKLKGIKCGQKATSCPDQLAIALENYMRTH